MKSNKKKIWNIGTDCSGIEAPIQALKQLKVQFNHVFSSDIDKNVKISINANYDPDFFYEDMTKRKVSDLPNMDIYVCGFPCQSFSLAGQRKGTNDKRGTIFWHCLKVIKNKLPKIFLLENVKGLLSIDKGKTFKKIIKDLNKIEKYQVEWKILNTKDYGIPQNRERVFIVGIRNDYFKKVLKNKYVWPKKKRMTSLSKYIDKKDNSKSNLPKSAKNMMKRIPEDSLFIDLNFRKHNYPNSNVYSPCLMTQGLLWCVPKNRYANIKECLSLQGFPKTFKQEVSDSQMKKQIGNSMSVNVIKELFKSLKIR